MLYAYGQLIDSHSRLLYVCVLNRVLKYVYKRHDSASTFTLLLLYRNVSAYQHLVSLYERICSPSVIFSGVFAPLSVIK